MEMPSLSLNWLWGRSIHALLMTIFVAVLIRWQEHFLLSGNNAPSQAEVLKADDHLRNIVLAGLIYTLLAAAVGTISAWILANNILRPLRLLQDGVARFAADRLDEPIPLTSENEVAVVSAAFNRAMERLSQQQRQLHDEMTQRARTQAELSDLYSEAEESNKAKDHFLAVLSHELRTPLTPVLTLAQMLERDESLTQCVREDITTIRRNVELEARLIDDLLDLTRITRGKVELRIANVNIHEKLREVVRMCQDEVDAKGLDVTLELWADQTSVRGDATRLGQIFWNLLRNAIKFTPAGGRISIQTHTRPHESKDAEHSSGNGSSPGNGSGSDLVIEVCDSGIGIEPAMMPRIFDAFEQGGREVTRVFGGLGLGLTISRALVQLHGGELRATSEGRDRGSTFSVRLPVVVGSTVRLPVVEPPPSDRRRILLVEDHVDTCRAMARLLTNVGYEVQTAQTVASAIQLTRSQHFDLIVSDIGLPDGTGHQLIRQLVAEAPKHELKGIAISGLAREEDVRASHEAGFMDHLAKPLDPETLLHVVEGALHEAKSDAPSEV
jgi:two-component system CheB/CheR fusion protein